MSDTTANTADLDTTAPLLDCTPANQFAHYTATHRWPTTIQAVIDDNKDKLSEQSVRLLNELIHACAADTNTTLLHLYPPSPHCTEYAHWAAVRQQYGDCTLLSTPWYVAESYLYHLILTACDYFPDHKFDPFAKQKHAELNNAQTWSLIESALRMCTEITDTTTALSYLIECTVYGNRVDLSYRAVSDDKSSRLDSAVNGLVYALQAEQANIVVNDTKQLCEYVNATAPLNFHIIHDNSGTELLCDLVLIYFLMCTGTAGSVTMHVKQYPTFVSDACTHDVQQTIEAMKQHSSTEIKQCGTALDRFIASNAITIQSHAFWNSTSFFDDMPDDLRQTIADADLTLIKGDANYRRTVHDRLWPTETSIYDTRIHAAQRFPSTFVLLRTLKSDTIVGVSEEQAAELTQADTKWRVNGKRGVIQMHLKDREDPS